MVPGLLKRPSLFSTGTQFILSVNITFIIFFFRFVDGRQLSSVFLLPEYILNLH